MSEKNKSNAAAQLLAQYKKVMEGRCMEDVQKDPIVSINMKLCQRLISARTQQADLGLIKMATSEDLQSALQVQTLWLIIYLFSLKDQGVSVVVQEPPFNDPTMQPKAKKRLVMTYGNPMSFWSVDITKGVMPKQPLVRLIPMQSGLYVELRKITQCDGMSLRSVHRESWQFDPDTMGKPVDLDSIKTRLKSNGFALATA